MKKLILFSMLLFSSMLCFGQTVEDLGGINAFVDGTKSFLVYIPNDPVEWRNYSVEYTIKNGYLTKPQNGASGKIGLANHTTTFEFRWDSDKVGQLGQVDITIKKGEKIVYAKKRIFEGVLTKYTPPTPKPPFVPATISGPEEVSCGQTITYKYVPKQKAHGTMYWTLTASGGEVSGFRIISEVANKDSATIVMQTLPIVGKDFGEFSLHINEPSYSISFLPSGSMTMQGFKVTKTIKIKKVPALKLEPAVSLVCNNGTITYSIKDTEVYFKPTISWPSQVTGLTLVSGQGTSKAIYKAHASYNGNASMKVAVTSVGKVFNIENSSVWVGTPKPKIKPILHNVFRPELFYKFEIVDELIPYDIGLSNLKWTVSGSASLSATQGNVAHVTMGVPSSFGKFKIEVQGSHKCGTFTHSFSGAHQKDVDDDDFGPRSLRSTSTYNIEIYTFPSGTFVKKLDNVANFNIQDLDLNRGTIYLVKKTDQQGNVTSEKMMLD